MFAARTITLFWLGLAAIFVIGPARAQDLYDPAVLRHFELSFVDSDWETQLRQNYVSQTNILSTLVVDGVTYPDVGVRIRGNTSFTQLPAGSQKFSLKLKLDFVDPDQRLLGYDTINLNNGFRDPTFSREVVYNNFVAQFIPNIRANNVVISINGDNWGVYNNVQQGNKSMLRSYFVDEDGLRISCANNPNGPGLRYNGPGPGGYGNYEIQNDGGLADPLGSLIAVTFALTNEPLVSWQNIDALLAIDPSIWSVALENLLTDDDSYVNKGCDFATYTDPLDGRMHLLQRDANETFSEPTWSPTRNFGAANKPLLSRVLAVPELRQRYMAHYRTLLLLLDWDSYLEPIFAANRARLDAAVQADPKKIYSYQLFLDNFTTTVNLPLPGLAGGTLVGLQPFVEQRSAFMAGIGELTADGPQIANVQASAESPNAMDPVHITASVAASDGAVEQVLLYYRAERSQRYANVAMLDDGASGDGAPADGVYGALLPITALPGQKVDYYVAAQSDNAFDSLSFEPVLAERGPLQLEYFFGSALGMRITEWMYSGAAGEFLELTNTSAGPIDLAGWSVDDNGATPGVFDLSALGVVQPGESVVITDVLAQSFRDAWSLAASVQVLGELGVVSGNNLGRNDAIHLYDATDQLQDRLFYGDQDIPGSIRARNASGQPSCAAVGFDNVLDWSSSVAGDEFGSYAAVGDDLGRPGFYDVAPCQFIDTLFADSFE